MIDKRLKGMPYLDRMATRYSSDRQKTVGKDVFGPDGNYSDGWKPPKGSFCWTTARGGILGKTGMGSSLFHFENLCSGYVKHCNWKFYLC